MKRENRGWRQGARRVAATALAVCLATSALPTTGLAEGPAKEASDVLVQGFYTHLPTATMAARFEDQKVTVGTPSGSSGSTLILGDGDVAAALDYNYEVNFSEDKKPWATGANCKFNGKVPLSASWTVETSYSTPPEGGDNAATSLDANNFFYEFQQDSGRNIMPAITSGWVYNKGSNVYMKWNPMGIGEWYGGLALDTWTNSYAFIKSGGSGCYGTGKYSSVKWIPAGDGVLTATFGNRTVSANNASGQKAEEVDLPPMNLETDKRVEFYISGWMCSRSSRAGTVMPGKKMSVDLLSIGYDHFAPEFVKVEYLDPKDQTRVITGGIGRGQEAVVRVTLKNSDLAAAGETIPAFLSLGDQAGFVSEGFETTQISGTKKIALNFVGNDEVSTTFKIKVTGDPETQFKLGLKVEDDPFGSYRSAYVLHDIGPDMVKGGVFPGDVNYTLTGTAGNNSWYTSNVDLNIQTNDYDLAYFDGVLADRMGKTFTKEGKTTTSFYAQQDGSRFSSKWGTTGIMSESVGIDKTAPTLALTDRSTLSLRAQDGVSGVWKIQVKRPGATSWEDMTIYTLTSGGTKPGDTGASSRDYQALNDCDALGTYQFRAVDAAGNATPDDKVLTVTRTDVAPVIVADDSLVFYGEKLPSGFVPRTAFDMIAGDDAPITHLSTNGVKTPAVHNALPQYTDLSGRLQDRVQLPDDQISWKLERLGLTASSFPVQRGNRSTQPVSVELPAGSYKLTFSLKGVDDDGNAALPKECFLYTVSYTHLDVYKRQRSSRSTPGSPAPPPWPPRPPATPSPRWRPRSPSATAWTRSPTPSPARPAPALSPPWTTAWSSSPAGPLTSSSTPKRPWAPR